MCKHGIKHYKKIGLNTVNLIGTHKLKIPQGANSIIKP